MRATILLALLPLAAAGAALAQTATGSGTPTGDAPRGGTAVQALGTAGATIDTGATDPGAPDATAPADPAANAATEAAAASGTDPAAPAQAAADPATHQGTVDQPTPGDAAQASDAAAGPIELRTLIGDKPIEIPADQVTEAFEAFRQSGENPFAGDEAALAEGKKVYAKLCQACHMPDGSGRIGPSLTDDQWRHPRLATQAGRFEIIHSGGAGAMQAFHRRIGIDEILKVMAYTDTFRAAAN